MPDECDHLSNFVDLYTEQFATIGVNVVSTCLYSCVCLSNFAHAMYVSVSYLTSLMHVQCVYAYLFLR